MPVSARGPTLFFRVWLTLWTVGTLIFDVCLAVAFAEQGRTFTFATTDGVVIRSGVKRENGSDGTVYRPALAYEYTVNGQRYTGTRYCYAEVGTNTRAWHDLAAEMPVGATVRVAYDPDEPSEALLRPGLTGFHLAMLWFVTPFNAIMVGGWMFLRRGRPFGFEPKNPRTVTPTDGGKFVRLPDIGRAGWFVSALAALCIIGAFVVGFGFGFNPPVALAGWLYIGAWALAARIATMHTPPWLEVDEVARVVRFTPGADVTEVSFDAIRDLIITPEKCDDGAAGFRYHVELVRADVPPDDPPARVATYYEEGDAAGLVEWLRERIGGALAATAGASVA